MKAPMFSTGVAAVSRGVLTLVLFASQPWAICQSNDGRVGQSVAKTDDSARHIANVETGLLPAAVIKGRAPAKMTLVDRMKQYNVPGVSIAFFEHGRITWTKTYGVTDLDTKKPVTPETMFQAASISKPFTAVASLRLVRQGKLSLDEDVNLKLRSWKVPEDEFTAKEKVTLRRILSHSAGLTVHGFRGYTPGEPLPTLVQILDGQKPANTEPVRVQAVPGIAWDYSGGGYVVLQSLLYDVTGEPFAELLHNLVLDPVGMKHSSFQEPLPQDLSTQAAIGYYSEGVAVKGGAKVIPEMAAGGLWSTPSDLARFAIEVQEEYHGRSDKLLSHDLVEQMLAHQKDDWGLGFALEASGQKRRFGHTGSNEGFRSEFEAYLDEPGQGVAIMSNADPGAMLNDEILRSVAAEYGWPDFHPMEHALVTVDSQTLSHYVGTYDLGGLKHFVSLKDGKLYIQAGPLGREPQQLLPEADNQFFVLSQALVFSFQKDEKGDISKMTIHVNNLNLDAKRLH